MTSAHDFERQANWEIEGTRRATARYREIEFGVGGKPPADLSTLPPGKALMRGVVKPLIAAITARQVELTADLANPGGRKSSDAWPFQVICPEKAAVITLISAVRGVGRTEESGSACATIISIAKNIADALRDQLHHDQWCQSERAANKAKPPKVDRLKALQFAYPNLDRRCWAKWARKLQLAELGDWDEQTSITMGANLIYLLTQAAPDRFTITTQKAAVGVQNVLTTTPEVRAIMNDVRERAEVGRPALMPMLIPPLPWCYAA